LKPSGARLLVGNLFFETEIARQLMGGDPPNLSRAVTETVAGAATLLRAFARERDRLWLPASVDPARVLPVPGLPLPRLESGLPIEPASEILSWAETPRIANLRFSKAEPAEITLDAPLQELLWQLPPPDPRTVMLVNHRSFCFDLLEGRGQLLPGARMLATRAELDRHLQSGTPGTQESWVLKAALSAAGRDRYIHPVGENLDPLKVQRRIERLFRDHSPLLFEPWMDRTADFGCAAVLTPSELRLASFHKLLVDSQGRFKGIELRAGFRGIEELGEKERAQMEQALDTVAAALRKNRYTGPFGIDAWRYRQPDGTLAFQPVGEINTRLTFGFVARTLVDRLREPLGLSPDARVRLLFGKGLPEARPGVIPLLAPHPASAAAAWIEVL